MFKRIDHVELIPRDFERTLDFYVNVLGFKVRERQRVGIPPLEEISYIELGDTVVELMAVTNAAPISTETWQAGYRLIALEVGNMDEAVEYLKGKGVPITWGPISLGASKRAEIKDPDGLPIELRQW